MYLMNRVITPTHIKDNKQVSQWSLLLLLSGVQTEKQVWLTGRMREFLMTQGCASMCGHGIMSRANICSGSSMFQRMSIVRTVNTR